MPMTLPEWLPGGGGEIVGPGKLGRPCARMHFARLSSSSVRISDDEPGPLPPPRNFAHAFWADWNAGDCVLMLFGMTGGPFGLGSGKFGTPCERMHSATLSAGLPLAAALLGLPEGPHAAIATAQLMAASAIERVWGRLRALLLAGMGMSWESFGLVGASVVRDNGQHECNGGR